MALLKQNRKLPETTMKHRLPAKVFEANLPRVLGDLAALDSTEEPLALDFLSVEYWTPAAIVSLCAMVNRWIEQGRPIAFENVEESPACSYLQRIDFFERVGLHLPETFQRRDPRTSFVEIQQVYPGFARLSEPLPKRLAECLAGTTDPSNEVLRFSQYALGEIIANCQQHAGKPGFVAAQYVASRDWARIGIADYGMGIRESFRNAESPHFREGMSHSEALEIAMTPWVSSKTHRKSGPYGESPNRGVGLKMVLHMLKDSCGEMFISSGDGWRHYQRNGCVDEGTLPGGREFPGTCVSILFDRGQIDDFQHLVARAGKSINLTPDQGDSKFFA
jgi:hypothetical protein